MPDRVTLTEAGLRATLRDPRYWTPGHPERAAYTAWVSDGYKAMYNSGEAKGGTVKVRAYDRRRDGKTEHVGAHTRGAPPGGLVMPVQAIPAGPGGRGRAAPGPLIPGLLLELFGKGGSLLGPGRTPSGSASVQRPSLLETTEEGERRRGTPDGAVQSVAPEENDQRGSQEPSAPSESQGSPGMQAAPSRLRPSPNTVEGLIRVAPPLGANSRGVPNFDGEGNEDQLDADAQALHPGGWTTDERTGTRMGDLPDGRRIIVRGSSERSDHEPTIEIARPVGVSGGGNRRFTRQYEIRYRPGRG